MKKRLYRITAAALMMTMLAASIVGCSKSSSGEAGSSAETSTADSGKQAAETGLNPSTPPEGVALKDDIVIGMKSKHTTIDPMEASNTQHNYMWRMVHDTPIHFNNETKELEPQLATEWSTDDGGKTYIFKLREGVKFHNRVKL